jgi:hypothetical protein
MRTEALLAGVFIFDFEDMSVGTFDANSHDQPTSRTTEDEKRGAGNKKREDE